MTWMLWDYGVGNLHSLRKALIRAGASAEVTTDPDAFLSAHVAVLPGVGAFGAVMESLAPVADGLRERHQAGEPIFGVCIGLQVLHDGSQESPGVPGLGILPGEITRLPPDAGKIPHMGWNTVSAPNTNWDGEHVYYVHTYAAPPGPTTTATTTYGMDFTAGERAGNTLAYQFHPEKSGAAGARILQAAVAEWGAP